MTFSRASDSFGVHELLKSLNKIYVQSFGLTCLTKNEIYDLAVSENYIQQCYSNAILRTCHVDRKRDFYIIIVDFTIATW